MARNLSKQLITSDRTRTLYNSLVVNLDAKIVEFLNRNKLSGYDVFPLAGDASDRRYYRLVQDRQTLILMDSSKTIKTLDNFLTVAKYLSNRQFSVPQIFEIDSQNGYLILEDFGNFTLKEYFLRNPNDVAEIYRHAVDLVISLVTLSDPPLPEFNKNFFLDELSAFTKWYLPYIGKVVSEQNLSEFNTCWSQVIDYLSENDKSRVFVHKDMHCDNLFWLPRRSGTRKFGIIDFQSAKSGSVVYDITSFIYDCRHPLLQSLQIDLYSRYLSAIGLDAKIFKDLCDIYIAQRNIKILGNFSYISQQKGNSSYLKYLPDVWNLINQSFENPILKDIKTWFLKNDIKPEF